MKSQVYEKRLRAHVDIENVKITNQIFYAESDMLISTYDDVANITDIEVINDSVFVDIEVTCAIKLNQSGQVEIPCQIKCRLETHVAESGNLFWNPSSVEVNDVKIALAHNYQYGEYLNRARDLIKSSIDLTKYFVILGKEVIE